MSFVTITVIVILINVAIKPVPAILLILDQIVHFYLVRQNLIFTNKISSYKKYQLIIFIYISLIITDYVKMENKWCEPQIDKTQNTLSNAEFKCNDERNCRMFFDLQSTNKTFVLCGASSAMKKSEFLGSSAYMKCIF